jgi:hypothetical protein
METKRLSKYRDIDITTLAFDEQLLEVLLKSSCVHDGLSILSL